MYRWEDGDGRGRGVQGRWKKQTITGEEKEEAEIWIGSGSSAKLNDGGDKGRVELCRRRREQEISSISTGSLGLKKEPGMFLHPPTPHLCTHTHSLITLPRSKHRHHYAEEERGWKMYFSTPCLSHPLLDFIQGDTIAVRRGRRTRLDNNTVILCLLHKSIRGPGA